MQELMITSEGFERLKTELGRLQVEGRRAVADHLRRAAASQANLAENAEYLHAREEQAHVERRISVLEEQLRGAQIVEPCLGNGRVDVGERVRVRDLASGRRLEVEIVGHVEADLA